MSSQKQKRPSRRRSTRSRQQEFQGAQMRRPKDVFGGSLLKSSHAKSKRPLHSKCAIHLVMHSKIGGLRRPKNFGRVNGLVARVSQKHGVRLYKYANVGNHLHLLLKLSHVHRWAPFIRELTGRIAQEVQNLKGPARGEKFWSQRPFTRVIRDWKRGYKTVKEYVQLNILEGDGFISRAQIRTLKDLRQLLESG